MDREILIKILEAGIQAPSGENCQPWYFKIDKNKIHIFNDPQKDTSPYNYLQRSALIAHGCLVENIFIAANQMGFKVSLEMFPEINNRNLIATLLIQEAHDHHDSLYEAIWQRCTNRKPYKKIPLVPEHKKELLRAAEVFDGIILKLVEDPVSIQRLAEVGATNEKIIFENQELHRFLFKYLLWSKKEEREKPGFYIKTLELPFPIKILFKIFKSWRLVKLINRIGFSKAIRLGNTKSNQAASAIGMIASMQKDDISYIMIGRALQRIWLTAIRLGLSMQPLTGILFFMQAIESGGGDRFSKKQIIEIKNQHEIASRIFQVTNENFPIMFRIGYSDPPSGRTSRFPISVFIKE